MISVVHFQLKIKAEFSNPWSGLTQLFKLGYCSGSGRKSVCEPQSLRPPKVGLSYRRIVVWSTHVSDERAPDVRILIFFLLCFKLTVALGAEQPGRTAQSP